MTVYFFVNYGLSSATARYRGYLVAEELNKMGINAVVCEPLGSRSAFSLKPERFKELSRNFKVLFFAKKEDIFYLARTIYQLDFFILVWFFKMFFKRKFVFDFDDPIFLRPGKTKRMTWFVKNSDAAMAGSHYLADWAKKYNKNVHIFPTCVPFSTFANFSHRIDDNKKELIIGWAGLGNIHYENLMILRPVFEELIKIGLPFKFILLGALKDKRVHKLFEEIKDLNAEIVDWKDPKEIPQTIQSFDIGVMPLVDSEWNYGKCALKALEYMASGTVTIVSPVGENNYVIKDGYNGFLAGSTEEWVDKIKQVHGNAELAKNIGQEAQKTVNERYSYEANMSLVRVVLENL